ncbi:MAG: hypothetical protein U0L76_04335 [Ruminococcus sp.]|nr:hypothetical protein [Ruminococcus sp.]
MWLMNYITQNSMTAPSAVKGNVNKNDKDGIAVVSSGEHKKLKSCFPYGIISVPPTGERAIVLPLDDGEVGLGVIATNAELLEGELMLYSKGGASIVLKNDGRVLINGQEVV